MASGKGNQIDLFPVAYCIQQLPPFLHLTQLAKFVDADFGLGVRAIHESWQTMGIPQKGGRIWPTELQGHGWT